MNIFIVLLQVRERAWFRCLYGEVIPELSEIIDRTGAQTMLYLTCTTVTSVDLAHYGVFRAKDWVYVDCGTNSFELLFAINAAGVVPSGSHETFPRTSTKMQLIYFISLKSTGIFGEIGIKMV